MPYTDRAVSTLERAGPLGRVYLWCELGFLFFAIPTMFALGVLPIGARIPALLLLTGVCVGALLRDPSFDRARLWNPAGLRRVLPRVVSRFAVLATLLGLLVWVFAPDSLFELVRNEPLVWIALMILYPLLSVYPQEITHRVFFFHRYRALLRDPVYMITVNAIAFSYLHVLFHNWVAPALTLPAGFLFALTYCRSRSALAVSVEHALHGCFIFTIGLGAYLVRGGL